MSCDLRKDMDRCERCNEIFDRTALIEGVCAQCRPCTKQATSYDWSSPKLRREDAAIWKRCIVPREPWGICMQAVKDERIDWSNATLTSIEVFPTFYPNDVMPLMFLLGLTEVSLHFLQTSYPTAPQAREHGRWGYRWSRATELPAGAPFGVDLTFPKEAPPADYSIPVVLPEDPKQRHLTVVVYYTARVWG